MTDDDLDIDLDGLDFGEWSAPASDLESKGKPQWTSHSCGAVWRNRESYAHCSECHLTFTADSGFDAHRYGPYDGDRRCRTADELAALGWTVKPGHLRDHKPTTPLWSMPAPEVSPWKKDKP